MPTGDHRGRVKVDEIIGVFALSHQQKVRHYFERLQVERRSQMPDHDRVRNMNDALWIVGVFEPSRGDFRRPGRTTRKVRLGLRKELLGWLAHNSFQSFKDRVRAIIARRRPIRNRIDEMTKWIGDIVAGPNGVLFIQVKGAAASTVRWVANVRTVEVTF